jgi:hypothetical protein
LELAATKAVLYLSSASTPDTTTVLFLRQLLDPQAAAQLLKDKDRAPDVACTLRAQLV